MIGKDQEWFHAWVNHEGEWFDLGKWKSQEGAREAITDFVHEKQWNCYSASIQPE